MTPEQFAELLQLAHVFALYVCTALSLQVFALGLVAFAVLRRG